MTKSFEWVGVSSKRVTKSFERVSVSSERVNELFERVGVSSKRVTKSFERVGVSSERVTKSFERMQIFFERFRNGCKQNPAQKRKVVKVRFPLHGHKWQLLENQDFHNPQELNSENKFQAWRDFEIAE